MLILPLRMSHKPDQFSKGTKVTVGKTDLATCDLDVRPRNRVVSYVHIPPLIDGLFLFAERPRSAGPRTAMKERMRTVLRGLRCNALLCAVFTSAKSEKLYSSIEIRVGHGFAIGRPSKAT